MSYQRNARSFSHIYTHTHNIQYTIPIRSIKQSGTRTCVCVCVCHNIDCVSSIWQQFFLFSAFLFTYFSFCTVILNHPINNFVAFLFLQVNKKAGMTIKQKESIKQRCDRNESIWGKNAKCVCLLCDKRLLLCFLFSLLNSSFSETLSR